MNLHSSAPRAQQLLTDWLSATKHCALAPGPFTVTGERIFSTLPDASDAALISPERWCLAELLANVLYRPTALVDNEARLPFRNTTLFALPSRPRHAAAGATEPHRRHYAR